MLGQICVPSALGIRPDSTGRPEASIPLAQFSFLTNGVALRNFPSVAVENVKKSVAVGLHQQITRSAVYFGTQQHWRFIGVVVVQVVGSELEVPFQRAGSWVQREDGGGVQVVAGTGVSHEIGRRDCWLSSRECRV